MKRLTGFILIAFIAVLAACSTTQQTVNDDIYSGKNSTAQNPGSKQSATQPKQPTASQQNDATQQDDNSAGNQKDNDDYAREQPQTQSEPYYSQDDYYDYAYTARMRRFYAPAPGYGYYDPYYTNSYWYDYNPASWGVSIYLGYSFWAPPVYYYDPFFYGPSIGFSFGYGYPYYSYMPFYTPYYSPFYSPFYSPYGGYHHGYLDGYYGNLYGYNSPYYFNSYDATSYHYAPRTSLTSGSRTTTSSPISSPRNGRVAAPSTLGQRYQQAMASNGGSESPARNARQGNDGRSTPSVRKETGTREGAQTPSQTIPSRSGIISNKNQGRERPSGSQRENPSGSQRQTREVAPANNSVQPNRSEQTGPSNRQEESAPEKSNREYKREIRPQYEAPSYERSESAAHS